MKKQPSLIQRATYKKEPYPNDKGVDKIISLDYMGSIEFEIGAIPESLRTMRASEEKYEIKEVKGITVSRFAVNKKGKDAPRNMSVFILSPPSMFKEVEEVVLNLAKDKYHYRTKESVRFELTDCDYDVWWDLDNHYMFCLGKEGAEKLLAEINKNKV